MIWKFKRALLAIILAQGAQSDIQFAESPQIQPGVCKNSSLEVRASDELCSQVPQDFHCRVCFSIFLADARSSHTDQAV